MLGVQAGRYLESMQTISEHLSGEPLPHVGAPLLILGTLLWRFLIFGALFGVVVPFLPFYVLLRGVFGAPPHVPHVDRWLRHLWGIVREQPRAPGLSFSLRLGLFLSLLQQGCLIPLLSLAWYVDEILYGRELKKVEIKAPLFELSAARSGSTQLAHYLEADPQFAAPNVMQIVLPYLWLWKLAPVTLGRLFSEEQVRQWVFRQVPAAYLERHELDPYATDTFEIPFIMMHLGQVSIALGPQMMREQFSAVERSPWADALWLRDLPDFIDAIGKKVLLYRGTDRRLLIKGHFLASAEVLEQHYPDAQFLTMLRDPLKRIQSTLNFHRCNPTDAMLGPIPWAWLQDYDVREEIGYGRAELAWYQRRTRENRCAVRFEHYRKDLEGTLRMVYQQCLGQAPVHTLPATHEARKRSGYQVDRSLEQLGIDPAWLAAEVADYQAWCEGK